MATQKTLSDLLPDDKSKPAPKPASSPKPEGTTRLTIDLDAALHRDLKMFALDQAGNAKMADVVRAAVALIAENPRYAKAVLDKVNKIRR